MNNPYDRNDQSPESMPSYGDYQSGANSAANFGYGSPRPDAYGMGRDSYPGYVDPSLPYLGDSAPGAGKRLGAFLIDNILIGFLAVIVITFLAFGDIQQYSDQLVAWSDAGGTGAAPEPEMGMIYLGLLLSLVMWFAYRVLMESAYGRTLGKMALGIKVVGEDGQNITVQQSLFRNSWFLAIAVLGNVPGIGMLLSLAVYASLGVFISRNPQNQHFCDQWAKSYVVNAR